MVQKVPLDVLLECLPEQNGLHEVVLSCGNMLLALEEKDVGSIGLVVVQKVSDLLVGVELGDFGVVVADPVGVGFVGVLGEGEVVAGVGGGSLRGDGSTLWMMSE